MFQIDTSIKISDIALVGGGIYAFFKTYGKVVQLHAEQGEFNRSIARVVGSEEHKTGLVGDVGELKKESNRHRGWLIEVQTQLGMKRQDRS